MSGLSSPDSFPPSKASAPDLPYLLPGFQNSKEQNPVVPSLQTFLSRRYPHRILENPSLPPESQALIEWLGKSEAPYFERSYHQGQPFRLEDLLTPSSLVAKCFNSVLNLILSILFWKQHEFNRQLLRYLKLKDPDHGGH